MHRAGTYHDISWHKCMHVCHCLLKRSYLGFWFCFVVSSFSSSDSPDTKLSPLTSSPAGIKMRRMPLLQCVMTVGMVWNAAAIWLKGAPNRSEPYPDPKDCEDLKGYIYCILYHISWCAISIEPGSWFQCPRRLLLPFQDFAALSKPPALVNPLLGGPGWDTASEGRHFASFCVFVS